MPDFCFLSSTSVLAPHYSASASSFPSLLGFTSQRFSRRPSPLSFPRFPLSPQHNLSCLPSRFPYSASCLFPFVLPCLTPTAVPQVLAFCLRFRPFPFFSHFLSSVSFPVLTTQPSVLPFPSSWPCLSVASPVPRFFLSASPLSTFSSAWFPMLLFRFLVLSFLFVSFHPSRFRSHSRSTGASLPPLPFVHFVFGLSACLLFSFVHSSLLLTTQPSVSPFPLLPAFASQWLSQCSSSTFASYVSPFFPARSLLRFFPVPVLRFLHFLSPSVISPHSGYLNVSVFFLSVFNFLPLAFALGSGYSAFVTLRFYIFSSAPRVYYHL